MNLRYLIFLVVLFIPLASSALNINSKDLLLNNSISLRVPSSSSCTCTGGGNSTGINETYADTLYWRLDGSNDPPTSSWNMGSKGFDNLGNSTLSGIDYFFKEKDLSTIIYWNQSGVKTNVIEFRPYSPDILFGASIDMQGFDILNLNNLTVLDYLTSNSFSTSLATVDGLTVNDFGIDMTGTGITNVSDVNLTSPTNFDPTLNFIESITRRGFISFDTSAADFLFTNSITGSNSDIIFSTGTTGEILRLKGSGAVITENVTANLIDSNCISSKEYITYTDAGGPPNGLYPYGTATTTTARGYPALYNMEITAITLSSSNAGTECLGADAVTNNSCKVAIVFNQSGLDINPFNITLNREQIKTVTTSINLTYNDQILVRGFGAVAGNVSTIGLSNAIIQFEAKRRC